VALLQDLIKEIDDETVRQRITMEVGSLPSRKSLIWSLRSICWNSFLKSVKVTLTTGKSRYETRKLCFEM